ncbi:hypothetical protein [Variovorax sp. E3]|uniref:hypothetical protein n=1 Tax=Variovorax sp. E3 TaxID=1914993 RepID=UPI0018DC98C6|nr:hypothetical protein [Variovorax sp. E3]
MKFKQSNTLRNAALAGAIATLLAFSGAAGAAYTPADGTGTRASNAVAAIDMPAPKTQGEEVAAARQDPLGFMTPATQQATQPVNTALVDSCASRWYWRSLLEEMACGFSGQGWFN